MVLKLWVREIADLGEGDILRSCNKKNLWAWALILIVLWAFTESVKERGSRTVKQLYKAPDFHRVEGKMRRRRDREGGDTLDFPWGLKRRRHYRRGFKWQSGIGHTTAGTFQAELDYNCCSEVALYNFYLLPMSFGRKQNSLQPNVH